MAALMSIIAADLTAALNMIEEYEKSHSSALKNIAAYHLQQAAEKLIKIQILSILYEPSILFSPFPAFPAGSGWKKRFDFQRIYVMLPAEKSLQIFIIQ